MKLRGTLLAAFAYVLLVVIVALEVPLVLNISRRVDAEIKAESSGQAQLIATTAADELNRRGALQRLVQRSATALGGRVLIVGDKGQVLVDSAGFGLRGTSYRDRPEISSALRGSNAQGRRASASLGEELLFTAVPIVRQGRTVGVVRVTQSVEAANAKVRNDALTLIGVGAAALLLGLAVAWLLAGFLTRPLGRLTAAARTASDGDLSARAPVGGPAEQREVAEAFNEMTARLELALAAQREFVANASHQLRTPLTGLRLRVEAASDQSDQEEVRDELTAAELELQRLSSLLDSLLVLAREGQDSPEPDRIDLARCAAEAYERWGVEAGARGHRLSLDSQDPAAALGSGDDVAIMLDNLIENALKYTPRGGTVTIETGADSSGAWVGLFDDGPGLAPGEDEALRRRFARGTTSAGTSGTGLGLAIVDVLARRWHGRFTLTNRPIGGLAARIELPVREADPNPHLTSALPGRS